MATWGIWLFVIGRRTLTSDLGENGVKTLVCVCVCELMQLRSQYEERLRGMVKMEVRQVCLKMPFSQTFSVKEC
jgi:hypothetical protein